MRSPILKPEGLYDPRFEHDACGVGLLVNIRGIKSHQLVEQGLQVLEHMVHRGAEGADPKTGDGAGIMVQIPMNLFCCKVSPSLKRGVTAAVLSLCLKMRIRSRLCLTSSSVRRLNSVCH